ncbi:hypothetical protein DID88_006090 [Monilinia fructigena]|uniref:Uncharacterized protein n=1 Tax=Monilinia fructigena TaxID=38457 RepID=A0A395J6T7_9HELO|nr:hypothetical protein DID88_006090 [Monilinia fructigena]
MFSWKRSHLSKLLPLKQLEERANATGEKLKELAPEDGKSKDDASTAKFKKIEEELDAIINDTKEFEEI